MNGDLAYGLGFILAVFITSGVLILVTLFAISKDNKIKRKYDERQELIRGRGFKYAFYTVIVMNMLYAVAIIAFERLPIEASLIHTIIALFGVGIYAWYCILNDGYFALNEKIPQTIICFLLIGILNIAIGIGELMAGNVVQEGVLTYRSMNFVAGIFMMVTVIVILIKQFMDKREV